MRVAKTKALISSAVTAKLICVFVFAYAKSRFSHDEAHLVYTHFVYSCFFWKTSICFKKSIYINKLLQW